MNKEKEYLLRIVKYILHNRETELPVPPVSLDWEETIALARRHSILNLLFYGIERLEADGRPEEKTFQYLQKAMMQELVKSYNQMSAAEELLARCEEKKIEVLAVKGVNTKHYYPEPDMRTMGDLDILYRDSQHEQIKGVMKELGYEGFQEGRKHDHYFRPPFIGVELHRDLVAAESDYSGYYSDIWSRVRPREGCRYVQEMTVEDQYIFTVVHLTEHFKNGGVGIRFLMDVFVYGHREDIDWAYMKRELEKLELVEFFEHISRLAKKWFGTGEEAETLKELEEYILDNGTYGSQKNAAALSVEKTGRIRFLLRAVFPGLKSMQSMYPWLKRYPVLLPFGWMLRGVRSFFCRRQNIRRQLDVYRNGDMEYGKELRQFYERCGL